MQEMALLYNNSISSISYNLIKVTVNWTTEMYNSNKKKIY